MTEDCLQKGQIDKKYLNDLGKMAYNTHFDYDKDWYKQTVSDIIFPDDSKKFFDIYIKPIPSSVSEYI